ncbi:MAG: mechanosensitive ion channel family protein [Planctomycetota bacterium]|nr:MAG: mechanosensitive ion channel family protein [Planctomycetota bacterium]
MDPYRDTVLLLQTWFPNLAGGGAETLARGILAVLVLVAAWLVNALAKRVILRLLRGFVLRTAVRWDDLLVEHRVFHRLSHLAPALVIHFSAGLLFPGADAAAQAGRDFVTRVALAYMVVVGALVLDAFLNVLVHLARDSRTLRDKPVRSYVQVVKILLWITTVILALAFLMGREPWAFLGGLGALTAVLLLVFKDSILGLVASIQIAALDLVRPGDWIEMPKYGADGDVIDLSLTTVKVQNWDKTVTSIPTYSLVSDSFKNWRGMSESGGRRIKRAVWIDLNSVRFVDDALLERLRKVQRLHAYLAAKAEEIGRWNEENGVDPSSPANGRRLTNLGTFRAYLIEYLRGQPLVHSGMTFLVRQLPPGPQGVGIEVYFFSREQRWAEYEAFQADLFDHILAVLPEFGLRPFQEPTGADLRALSRSARADA